MLKHFSYGNIMVLLSLISQINNVPKPFFDGRRHPSSLLERVAHHVQDQNDQIDKKCAIPYLNLIFRKQRKEGSNHVWGFSNSRQSCANITFYKYSTFDILHTCDSELLPLDVHQCLILVSCRIRCSVLSELRLTCSPFRSW